ncbi:MAG: lipid-A-disaccharide synthase [Proteobacteria bacterium]|nr:lipid-A-disaccharide synthase [Pseudomonadota bacterium]
MAFKKNPLIYLVAGEASGDLLGSRLMTRLLTLYPEARFMGIGGTRMCAQGMKSLFPMEELSLMGLAEVLPHARRLLGRIQEVAKDIEAQKPDVLVTIDAPGFNFRLAKKVRALPKAPAMIHYTAPTVWAWRPKRAEKIAHLFDHLMTLFPFEPPYFTPHGLKTTFVGHPLVEDERLKSPAFDFRQRYGIDARAPLLMLLAGSRLGEITRHGPMFMKAVRLLQEKIPGLQVVCPTLPGFEQALRGLAPASLPMHFVSTEDEKYAAMWAADAALAASGTVTLELALTHTPMVVAYKVNWFTALLLGFLMKTPFVSLVNILEGREIVAERLQKRATPTLLAQDLEALFGAQGTRQRAELKKIRAHLMTRYDADPSLAAAQVVSHYF